MIAANVLHAVTHPSVEAVTTAIFPFTPPARPVDDMLLIPRPESLSRDCIISFTIANEKCKPELRRNSFGELPRGKTHSAKNGRRILRRSIWVCRFS